VGACFWCCPLKNLSQPTLVRFYLKFGEIALEAQKEDWKGF